MSLNKGYCNFLNKKLKDSPPKLKSDRTHAALNLATARLLEKDGYNNLRVADISFMAGVGTTTFHYHYKNRTEAAKEVLIEFLEEVASIPFNTPHDAKTFARIYYGNKVFIDIFQANPGLMRCMFQLWDQDKEFSNVWREMSLGWYQRVAETTVSRHPEKIDKSLMYLTIYSLGGMVDEFLRGLYLYQDSSVLEIIKDRNLNNDAIAYFITAIWYRSIFGKDPDETLDGIDPDIIKIFDEGLGIRPL